MRSAHTLPEEYWRDGTLYLPSLFWAVYRSRLEECGWIDRALEGTMEENIHGGASEVETLSHLAYRFAGSAAHITDVFLDPQRKFDCISSDLLVTLCCQRVVLLDAFCGAGAASVALIAQLVNLRNRRLAPLLPLALHVTGADFSHIALEIFDHNMLDLRNYAADAGIELTWHPMHWDASKSATASQLCDEWISGRSANEYLVLISSISGVGSEGFRKLCRSIQHLEERLAGRPGTMLWIEPMTQTATQIFQDVRDWRGEWDRNMRKSTRVQRQHKCFCHNAISGGRFKSRTRVMRYVRYE